MSPQTTILPHRAARLAPAQTRTPPPVATIATVRPEIEARETQAREIDVRAIDVRAIDVRTDRPEVVAPPQRGVWIDRAAWLATIDGQALELTYLEFEVLDFFVQHPGRAYSRQALLYSVWGRHADDASAPDVRTVDVLVTRLRRKLGPRYRDRIETIRRVGYRYRPAPSPSSSHSASTR